MIAYGRASTGISGLDELLGGGIPEGRVIVVLGGPGTGKTILSTHFILEGLKRGEPGVFISLDENKTHYYNEMSKFGWRLDDHEKKKHFAFLDASPIRHIPGEVEIRKILIGREDFSMLSLIESINSTVKEIDAKRIVVDPISSLIFQYADNVKKRGALLDLAEAIVATNATAILSAELESMGENRAVQIEEYLAHGVIVLQTLHVGRAFVRVLQVEKMRESTVDNQPRPYRIGSKGIEVFPKENVF